MHGTSGAQLRHKRKRLPRIESDSAGYKVLRKKVKQLKKTGSHGEIYNLLRQLWTFEQSLVARGLPLPFALRESGTQKDIAEVVDITDENLTVGWDKWNRYPDETRLSCMSDLCGLEHVATTMGANACFEQAPMNRYSFLGAVGRRYLVTWVDQNFIRTT